MFVPTRFLLSTAAAVITALGLNAEVPFQPLTDFGSGGGASDINAQGTIVGSLRTADGSAYVAVFWSSTSAAPSVLPSTNNAFAAAINSNNQIVGCESLPVGPGSMPVLWENGTRIVLPDLGEGGTAVDISESGVIVGNVFQNGEFKAARWINRQLEVLPVPAFSVENDVVWSFATSINSSNVISGTIQGSLGTPATALRWTDAGVQAVTTEGLETKGIAIDNLGRVALNGYFGPAFTRQPARVSPNGTLSTLPVPAAFPIGAFALCMSRNGIVAGYAHDISTPGYLLLRPVAWPNDQFTVLGLPPGTNVGFPGGVGINGVVVGGASSSYVNYSVPGFWTLNIESSLLQSNSVRGNRGQTVTLSATSRLASGAVNVGNSISVKVNGVVIGQAITDEAGIARLPYTIPSNYSGSVMTVTYAEENGNVRLGRITVLN